MAYRTGSFQKEKALEVGIGVAFFYSKESEKFICSKKTYSILDMSPHIPWLSNRFLESAPVCLWPLLLRNCSCFPGLMWWLQLLHLPGPLGSTFKPSVPKREQRDRVPPGELWAPTPGCAPGALQGHASTSMKATWDSLHLHCQAACPGVPTLGVRWFLLWITPDKQKQSASWCPLCGFMVDLCWKRSVFQMKLWKDICNKENVLTAFSHSKNFNKSFNLGTPLHTVLYT